MAGFDEKLSYEIFSILESKFLFSQEPGKIRILSIDSASDGGLLAAVSLSRLESLLKKQSGDSSACIADFFDLAAGAGPGGLLAALLFTRGAHGRPLFTAEEALKLVAGQYRGRKKGMFGKISFSRNDYKLKNVFSHDLTLRDTIKPVLVSCFDMLTGSPFMFSRSDAVESDGYDFLIRDVCKATTCKHTFDVRSVDGKTELKAVGGGVGIINPTAAAITHVLNNKREFPFADGMEELFVFSVGSGVTNFGGKIERVAGDGAAEVVDQSVAMAFGEICQANYVRIQGFEHSDHMKAKTKFDGLSNAENVMAQRYLKSVMFRGKKLSDETNGEKVHWVGNELMKEHDRRKNSNVPFVMIKPAVATPRTSSATTATTVMSSDTLNSL